jgi:Xaa-Pro aminopeptidase
METQSSLFTEHREKLAAQLPPSSAAILTSNDTYPSNADGTLPFFQNTNLYYLTGIRQEETLLLLFPGHPDENLREVLFIREVDERFVKWNGHRLSLQQASEISGIATVLFRSHFDRIIRQSLPLCEEIFLHTDEHLRSEKVTETAGDRLVKRLRSEYPLHRFGRLYPLLARQRTVKTEGEIEMLRKACAVTEAGFRRVLRFVKPGVNEKQIEAEMIHEYMQHGTGWADYEPIVASGKDTCILHYHGNNKICGDGDLVLIDAAAGWRYYNADLTRVVPVSGSATTRC